MDLQTLPSLAEDYPAYRDLKAQLDKGGLVQLEGVPVTAKAWLLAQLAGETGRPLALVTYNADQAQRLSDDLRTYGVEDAGQALLVSATDTLIFNEGAPDLGILGQRTAALQRLARGEAQITVGPIGAWLQRTVRPELIRDRLVGLTAGETVDLGALQKTLVEFGYERVEAVEQPGQWTRRGDILDVFPGDAARPFRVDFFGDDVEAIRPFDPDTQRSSGKQDALTIRPVREVPYEAEAVARAAVQLQKDLPGRVRALREADLEGRGGEHAERMEERVEGDLAQMHTGAYFDDTEYYLPFLYPDAVCALDYLPADALLVLDEPSQAKARWEQTAQEVADIAEARAARGEWITADARHACPFDTLTDAVRAAETALALSLLGREPEGLKPRVTLTTQSSAMESFTGRLPAFYEAVESWLGFRFRVVLVTEQAEKLRQMLAERRLPASPLDRLEPDGEGGLYVMSGVLLNGFKLPEGRLMVATDTDIFGHRAHQKAPKRSFKDGLKITSYLELREGDYVVHIHHGIGRYAGITRLKGADGAERDYLLLLYAEGDKVYVPTDQVDRVQKYIGNQDSPPTITRLNSGDWARATKRAKKQVQEMAADLIKLYAARQAARRPSLPPDTPWQQEMEEDFPFQETPDQLSAIEDVKKDLEDDKPMDRLICGDVGYGKTEVAIRAAFKAASSGRQVAVLCPTTILAQQHLNTFRKRLAAYPVRVEMLSRFVSKSEATQTIRGLGEGIVDIVIGTHKLLGKDIKFHNLGLLVVDEEQRFGVSHKERIKNMRKSVDVLTLSATPIPRTLHMSLSGIRDMSLIDDPPEGRLPIKTYVKEYDDELVREVLMRELDRGGQIYFLHNRVESISHMAEKLRRLVPTAKVEFAHGQMHEDDLEDVMSRFSEGEFNVLVCTTIVESGLDISNVNTIVVDNADRLGLSQLYQIRGRIGRSRRQGYAYFLYRKDKVLTEVAEKRLSALREFSDLGSGYKVALRDLEIRGAGNLLGAEQSGTVATVGFDLYTQLLSQAINELKGDEIEAEFELPNISLPLDAFIPERYIPSEAERILMYKKLTAVRRTEDVARIQEELEDRYGDPPRSVWNLLAVMRLRLRCQEIGIGSIIAEKRRVAVRFSGTHLPPDAVKRLARTYMQHQFLPDVVFLATPDTPAKMLNQVEEMAETLAGALPPKPAAVPAARPKPTLLHSLTEDTGDSGPANGTSPAKKPADTNGKAKTAATDTAKTRNLVSNQVSARRRGTYNKH